MEIRNRIFFLIILFFINNYILAVKCQIKEYSEGSSEFLNSYNENKNETRPILKFNKDKTFKIVQFTDMHYGYGHQYDQQTLDSQEIILEKEKPDFVMFSGDMISGYLVNFNTSSTYEYYWDKFTKPLVKRNIPWAITMGNHDAQGLLGAEELVKIDQNYRLSLTKRGPSNIPGTANYFLKIYSSNTTITKDHIRPLSDIYIEDEQSNDIDQVSSLIYIFDSDITAKCNEYDWGCINKNQLEWFKNVSNKNQKKDSVSFIHIPPIEIIDLWNNHDDLVGSFDEKSCCFDHSRSRFVDVLLNQGDVRGLYFGHDHKNDFHGHYKGMDMGYGRKSGAGSYSSTKPLGARVIQLNENQTGKSFIKSWIREEDGNLLIQTKPIYKKHYKYRCDLKKVDLLKDILQIFIPIAGFVSVFEIVILFLIIRKRRRFYLKQKDNKDQSIVTSGGAGGVREL